MSRLRVLAPAKVNLALEVLGRRPDGYHELRSVVHTIALADELTFEDADTLQVVTAGANVPPEENLVYRAAALLRESFDVQRGAAIRCVKRIPLAAGLGGGSSDAAATLRGLAALWDLGVPPVQLDDLAARLGSDVPALLQGGAALIAGRGEMVKPLPVTWRGWLVVVPPAQVSPAKTATLYALLRPDDFSAGDKAIELAERLERGEPFADDLLVNAFTRAARAFYPGLDGLWQTLERASGARFYLSGAGPSLFSVHRTRADAEACQVRIAAHAPAAFVTETVGPSPAPEPVAG